MPISLVAGRSPRYIADIKGISSSSTFTVAEPGNASTVSHFVHRCSSWSRITTRSPTAELPRKIVFDDDAGFHLLLPDSRHWNNYGATAQMGRAAGGNKILLVGQ
jgi:hypothetical protein